MDWAAQRRFVILSIIGAVIAAFLIILAITVFYKAPSCSDGVQNQGEAGIDCGGPCPYLCTDQEQAPIVLFTKVIPNGTGRTDVIASIENRNAAAAAKAVPYTLTLYGAGQVILQKETGILDLPPAATVPVFIPNVATGNQTVTAAFLSIAPSAPQWYTFSGNPRTVPVVTNTTLSGSSGAPRIDATLSNSSSTTLNDVVVIVFVHNDKGDVIAASQTVVPTIPPQGEATATFTWGGAFSGIPATIEVFPIIPLP